MSKLKLIICQNIIFSMKCSSLIFKIFSKIFDNCGNNEIGLQLEKTCLSPDL